MENNENKAKTQRIIIAALILGMMFCIGITIWAVFFRKPETKSLVPDYAPQQTEQYAEPLEDNSRNLDVLEGEADKLSEGTYSDANFRVLSYDPQSGEKAMVDTVAKITVTVEK